MTAPRPNELVPDKCLVTSCCCGCGTDNGLYDDGATRVICCQELQYLSNSKVPHTDALVKLANISLGLCIEDKFSLSSDNASWKLLWDKKKKEGSLIDIFNNWKLFFSSREMY